MSGVTWQVHARVMYKQFLELEDIVEWNCETVQNGRHHSTCMAMLGRMVSRCEGPPLCLM